MAKQYPLLHKLYPPPKPITKTIVRTKTITKTKRIPGQPTTAAIDAAVVRREKLRRINSADAAIITWRSEVAGEPYQVLAYEYGLSVDAVSRLVKKTRELNLIRAVTVPECRAMGLDDSLKGGRFDALDGVDMDTLTFNDPDPELINRRHLYNSNKMSAEEIRLALVLIRLGKRTAMQVQEQFGITPYTWRDYAALYSPWGRTFREEDGTYSRMNDRRDRIKKRRTASNPIPRVKRKLDPETQEIAEAELDRLEEIHAARGHP